MALPLPKVVADVEAGGPFVTAAKGLNALKELQLKNKYYGPNIESEIANRNALTEGQNIHNQYLPEEYRIANALNQQKYEWNPRNWESEIGLRSSQSQLGKAEAEKINYILKHPGLMGGDEAKTIQSLMDMGYIPNKGSQQSQQNGQSSSGQMVQSQPLSPPNAMQIPTLGNQTVFDQTRPFNTGNAMVDSILNKPYAETAYRNKMTHGFNWVHLPVETKNQLVAQGYGMGIEPLKMMEYVNNGMTLQQIAEKEGLDPENLPPPIYSPTTATKTRVQQVQQVGNELDYLSSSTTPIIKRYANTFAGFSGDRIRDMLSNDVAAQKRFGQYIGALSVQSGLANGRVLLEGGRPGVEVMRMVKDSALQGIDQHSPIKMSGVAYEEAQKTIDDILHKGAKIRTTTGMNPMSEIGKNRDKSSEKEIEDMTKLSDEELRKIINE